MNKFVPLRRHHRERGVTAIEFAILFPVFFSILYAIIQYGMIFAAQQTLTLAAEEGARSALQYQTASSSSAALTSRQAVALSTCVGLISWLLPLAGQSSSSQTICTSSSAASSSSCPVSTMDCVWVTTAYPYSSHPIIPTLPLLGWAVPNTLGNTATVQIDPANII